MSDVITPEQNRDRGHRNSNAIEDVDEFGFQQRLKRLKKGQYWGFIALFAVGFTIFSFVWQTYWLPEKPIVWKPWTNFQAQQTISLKRPLLVAVTDNQATSPEWSGYLESLDSPNFRKAFHLRSGQALLISTDTTESECATVFATRPPHQTLWLVSSGGSLRQIQWPNTSREELIQWISKSTK